MIELSLPDDSIVFPSTCACCLKETKETRTAYRHKLDVGFGDPKAKTKKLQVPYCAECRAHVDWSTGGGYLGVFLSIIVNLILFGALAGIVHVGWTLGSNWAYEHPDTAGWILGVATVAVVAFLAWRRLAAKGAVVRLRGRHARRAESVEIAGFQEGRYVKLRVYNREWAKALTDLNESGRA